MNQHEPTSIRAHSAEPTRGSDRRRPVRGPDPSACRPLFREKPAALTVTSALNTFANCAVPSVSARPWQPGFWFWFFWHYIVKLMKLNTLQQH